MHVEQITRLFENAAGGMQFYTLVPWIVFFPVIGLLINILFGKRMSEKAIGVTASVASGLSFVIAVLQAIALVGNPEGAVVPLAEWIHIGELNVRWAFQVDTLSVTMMLVVSGVGTLIHIYAIGYMHEDVRLNQDPASFRRFFVYMNLFIAAMMILVSADNYLMLFVGWEGVGLCSYLLIGFWFDKGKDGIGNALAAKKAFVVNRVGDFGFMLAAFTLFWAFGTYDFKIIFEKAPEVAQATILAITLFMLLGVTGKSAQIPLYVWLPDAMAGPTPVSALIHAATMVTAGVYLVARSYPLYSLVPQAQAVVALVGGATALFAATIAVGQFDIKKVLAYSTISQLGFMVAAVGMGAVVAGIFHLVTHAFFKALLFLSAGSVIQGIEHGHHHAHERNHHKAAGPVAEPGAPVAGPVASVAEPVASVAEPVEAHHQAFDPQDMRNMGGLRNRMKITFWVYLIGAIALAGIPPLAGFWSKDEILLEESLLNPAVYILLTAAAFLTAFYMGRQVLMVFFGEPRSAAARHASENPLVMTVPLIILAGLSVLGGTLNLPGILTFSHWIEHTLEGLHEAEFSLQVAGISTGLALIAILLAWYIYYKRYPAFLARQLPSPLEGRGVRGEGGPPLDPLASPLGPVFTALMNKWWVDELYQAIIVRPYQALSRFLAEVVDWRFWHDWLHDTLIVGGYNRLAQLMARQIDLGGIDAAANGLAELTKNLSSALRRLQTGYVRNYALAIFLGMVVIIGYLILRNG